jgi:hypothetical protein
MFREKTLSHKKNLTNFLSKSLREYAKSKDTDFVGFGGHGAFLLAAKATSIN